MKDGSAEESTSITLDNDDFDQALNYLQEHFNVIHSYKQNGEILIKAERDYRTLLKAHILMCILNILKHVKIRFEIRTLILIKEVTIR